MVLEQVDIQGFLKIFFQKNGRFSLKTISDKGGIDRFDTIKLHTILV